MSGDPGKSGDIEIACLYKHWHSSADNIVHNAAFVAGTVMVQGFPDDGDAAAVTEHQGGKFHIFGDFEFRRKVDLMGADRDVYKRQT